MSTQKKAKKYKINRITLRSSLPSFCLYFLFSTKYVQGMPSSGRESEAAIEQRLGSSSKTDQVLVPKQKNSDEGSIKISVFSFDFSEIL